MGKLISKNTSKLFWLSAERTNEIQGRKETANGGALTLKENIKNIFQILLRKKYNQIK
jgi:hypothetical protein